MNNTRVIEDREGRFAKDKRSERNQSILPEEATHFGDAGISVYGRSTGTYSGRHTDSWTHVSDSPHTHTSAITIAMLMAGLATSAMGIAAL